MLRARRCASFNRTRAQAARLRLIRPLTCIATRPLPHGLLRRPIHNQPGVHCDGRHSAGDIEKEQLVSMSGDHSHPQHGRHHRGQLARFGITRTTKTVFALACAAVMFLVGTWSIGQARLDDGGGGVRATPTARAYPSSPGRCLLERIGDQLVRCDNLTGAGAVAPPWVPEQASARAYLSTHGRRCPLERIGDQLVRCDNLTGAGAVAPPWVPEQARALNKREP